MWDKVVEARRIFLPTSDTGLKIKLSTIFRMAGTDIVSIRLILYFTI
jgi:hypothetical protein